MASSENFPAIDPWAFRSAFPDTRISQAFIRDNEVLTRALHVSLSSNHPETVSPDPPRVHPRFESDPGITALKRPKSAIGKKKLRKSKQDATTTFIMADPSNFRQMVQQVTGERFSGNWQVAAPFKPEPQRLVQGYLPTIDASAFLVDSEYHRPQLQGEISVPPPPLRTTPTANFDPLSCFPTLESCSWKAL